MYLFVADHTLMEWLFFFLLNSMKLLSFVIVTNSYHHYHHPYHQSIKMSSRRLQLQACTFNEIYCNPQGL